MKPHPIIARLFVLAAFAVGAGCNDGQVNRTIPPVAGIAGGPTAANQQGVVAVEIQTPDETVAPGTFLTIANADHEEYEHGETLHEAGDPFGIVSVRGDVGDEVVVTFEHTNGGTRSVPFTIPSPRIFEIRGGAQTEPVIFAGEPAGIYGEGFCGNTTCNRIYFDGTALSTIEQPRPGLVYFVVPTNATLGMHTVSVNVAGIEGEDPHYSSPGFQVELVAP